MEADDELSHGWADDVDDTFDRAGDLEFGVEDRHRHVGETIEHGLEIRARAGDRRHQVANRDVRRRSANRSAEQQLCGPTASDRRGWTDPHHHRDRRIGDELDQFLDIAIDRTG